jgi:hypothetical protein
MNIGKLPSMKDYIFWILVTFLILDTMNYNKFLSCMFFILNQSVGIPSFQEYAGTKALDT